MNQPSETLRTGAYIYKKLQTLFGEKFDKLSQEQKQGLIKQIHEAIENYKMKKGPEIDEKDMERIMAAAESFFPSLIELTELQKLAAYDPITDVYNRRAFHKIMDGRKEQAEKTKPRTGAILFIDLDFFKDVNDHLGHEAGDILLKKIGETLKYGLRPNDIPCRVGGDELVVFLDGVNAQQAKEASARIFKMLTDIGLKGEPFEAVSASKYPGELKHRLSISMGVKPITIDNDFNLEKETEQADRAAYKTKHSGRTGITVITKEIEDGKLEAATTLWDKETGAFKKAEEDTIDSKKTERALTRDEKYTEITEALNRSLGCVRGANNGKVPPHVQDAIADLADVVYMECSKAA